MTERPRRFPWWGYGLFLIAIALFAFGPLICVLLASAVADANGCMLNEGSINPCVVAGADVSGLLYTLFVMGWFSLATLPLGGGAFLVWLVSLIIHRIAWGQMQKVGE